MSKTVSVRELRENLASVLDDVARGEQVVITRRGDPVARIIPPVRKAPGVDSRYPLRGSVRRMNEDFDEPLEGLWESLQP